MCSGASCEATFEDVVFDRCSLLGLSAAQATLSNAAFRNMDASQSGLGVLVHGVSTRVAVQGGTVAGGTQVVAVQAGGHLEATGLAITGVGAVGAEVQGEGSTLSLTECEMSEFRHPPFDEDVAIDLLPWVRAVHVHSSSSAHLSFLSVRGVSHGVLVRSSASATLVDSTMSDCQIASMFEHATGHLTNCKMLSGEMHGLYVFGAGSSVHAIKCHFENVCSGA